MRGLTIVLAEADPTRLRTALTMAIAQVALGGGARLFLDAAAVPALREPIRAEEDGRHRAAGQPGLADLVGEAHAATVEITLCQTGLQLAGAAPDDFDPRVRFGGMVGLLATLGEDRLVAL